MHLYKKKSLGQHFLHAPSYLQKIADVAKIEKGERVLEVGPGDGALTEKLLEKGARVIAIEKDHRLILLLKEKFGEEDFEVIEADVLRFDISKHFQSGAYKVVANIPYYITGALLKKFLSGDIQPKSMALLVQKEVAERIARSRKESILSLSIKAYGEPQYIKTVPRGAFSPPPGVDSAILTIENISRRQFKSKKHEEKFFELVRTGFGQKRKLLKNNLLPIAGDKVGDYMQQAGIPLNTRAEDVPLEKWNALASISSS